MADPRVPWSDVSLEVVDKLEVDPELPDWDASDVEGMGGAELNPELRSVDSPAPKPRQQCSECCKPYHPNQLLVNHGDNPCSDWQGGLWKICWGCFQQTEQHQNWHKKHGDKTELEFKRAIKRMWRARQTGKAKERSIARSSNFKATVDGIMGHPDNKGKISKSHAKKMAQVALTKAAAAVAAAVMTWTTTFREQILQINAEYLKDKDAEARDPTYVTSVDGKHVGSEYLQFLQTMFDGIISRVYICRHINCGFFSLNIYWIPSYSNGQFRCPNCGEQYQAFRTHEGLVPAHHVFIFTLPGEGTCYMLAKWPQSAEEAWINKQMESQAGLTAEDALLDEDQLMSKIVQISRKTAVPFGWSTFRVTPQLRGTITEWDKTQPAKQWLAGLRKLEELAPDGFPGGRLQGFGPNTPILQGEDLIRLINLVSRACQGQSLSASSM